MPASRPDALKLRVTTADFHAIRDGLPPKTSERFVAVVKASLRLTNEFNETVQWAAAAWANYGELSSVVHAMKQAQVRISDAVEGWSPLTDAYTSGKKVLVNALEKPAPGIRFKKLPPGPIKRFAAAVKQWESEAVAALDSVRSRISELSLGMQHRKSYAAAVQPQPAWADLVGVAMHALQGTHDHFSLQSKTAPARLHLFIPKAPLDPDAPFRQIVLFPESDYESVVVGRQAVPIRSMAAIPNVRAAATPIKGAEKVRMAFSFSQLMRIENAFRVPHHVKQALHDYFRLLDEVRTVAAADTAEINRYPKGDPRGGQFAPADHHVAALTDVAGRVAENLSFSGRINVVSDDPPTVDVAGRTFGVAGQAFLESGETTVFAKAFKEPEAAAGLIAHEIMHHKYEHFLKAVKQERDEVSAHPGPAPDPNGEHYYQRRGGTFALMSGSGALRPPYDKRWPLFEVARLVDEERDLYAADDGITDYSKAWWEKAAKSLSAADVRLAFHETLAEMARIHYTTGVLQGSERWKRLYKAVGRTWTGKNLSERMEARR